MTAKEFIKENTFQTEEDAWNVVEVEYALEAISMARQEEREKAVKEFKALAVIAVSPIIHNERKIIKTANELTNVFTELINK